jgi:hypothetical protein
LLAGASTGVAERASTAEPALRRDRFDDCQLRGTARVDDHPWPAVLADGDEPSQLTAADEDSGHLVLWIARAVDQHLAVKYRVVPVRAPPNWLKYDRQRSRLDASSILGTNRPGFAELGEFEVLSMRVHGSASRIAGAGVSGQTLRALRQVSQ